jgi:hypothetical protein
MKKPRSKIREYAVGLAKRGVEPRDIQKAATRKFSWKVYPQEINKAIKCIPLATRVKLRNERKQRELKILLKQFKCHFPPETQKRLEEYVSVKSVHTKSFIPVSVIIVAVDTLLKEKNSSKSFKRIAKEINERIKRELPYRKPIKAEKISELARVAFSEKELNERKERYTGSKGGKREAMNWLIDFIKERQNKSIQEMQQELKEKKIRVSETTLTKYYERIVYREPKRIPSKKALNETREIIEELMERKYGFWKIIRILAKKDIKVEIRYIKQIIRETAKKKGIKISAKKGFEILYQKSSE